MTLLGFTARREAAERHAVNLLALAGDPVASAIKAAVRDATTVELTPELVASFSHSWGNVATPDGMTQTEFLLMTAYQAAGFEVTR